MSFSFRLTLITVLFVSVFASRAAVAQYQQVSDYTKANPAPPPKPACVINVKKTITVNKLLDGKGCLYQWRGAGYPKKCHRPEEISENEPRMFVLKKGAVIKNLQMECSLDGILTAGNNVIDNIINRDCEEDCITVRGNNVKIQNSKFYLCQDKCITVKNAKNVEVNDNEFYHGLKIINGNAEGVAEVSARGNYCYNCHLLMHARAKHVFSASDNEFAKGKCLFETSNSAVIYDDGGNTVAGAAKRICPSGTHNIKVRNQP